MFYRIEVKDGDIWQGPMVLAREGGNKISRIFGEVELPEPPGVAKAACLLRGGRHFWTERGWETMGQRTLGRLVEAFPHREFRVRTRPTTPVVWADENQAVMLD